MPLIKIYTIRKIKEQWLQDALDEYQKRLKPYLSIEYYLAKNNDQLIQWTDKINNLICLDPTGQLMTSEEFANWFHRSMTDQGAKLNVIIGGPEGIPSPLKRKSSLISLSKLTFTHQIARLILLEQVYRAYEIQKGSGYHKS